MSRTVDVFSIIEWDPERFGIGIRQIDEQHKQLILVVNTLSTLVQEAHHQQKVQNAARAALNTTSASGAISRTTNANSFEKSSVSSSPPSPALAQLARGKADPITPASHLRSFNPTFQKGSKVCDCLGRLVSYSLRNLTSEDHILETYSYADRATQQQEHAAFAEQMCRYLKLSEEFSLEEGDLIHLLTFLKLWVREHIPRDRRYAPLLLEKGIGV